MVTIISISYYKINRKRKHRKHLKLTNKWKRYLDSLIADEHPKSFIINKKYYNKLYSIEELMAFYAASLAYLNSDKVKVRDEFRKFIRANKKYWVNLGFVYGRKRMIFRAYFAFICRELCINNPEEYDTMTKLILDYVLVPFIYCRENALKALYAFGNTDAVVEAFIRLSHNNITHNRKLVTDGLLQFKGNKIELAETLYDHFDKFNVEYQVAFIDFFRFSGEKLKYKLKKLLEQQDADREIICALLRYYGKYPVLEYKDIILSYLTTPNYEDWECISSAASALGKYPGEDTIIALKSALKSKYWYVRLNAARSIAELDVEKDKLMDILDGEDLYAKEQLLYQITHK